ncbi:MAG: glycosyltransferase family 61 protein [Rhodocyclaceae bacterium]|nr:glycosyltransferase family 61 protein [Rhodocyclaceae bacterium]MCO5097807.1 glycosyltransferase family 61 protein [Rhodocyclaceae bacterium]
MYLTDPPRYPLRPLSTIVPIESRIILAPSSRVVTPTPAVFPAARARCLVSPHEWYEFPPIYLCTLANALVTGGTNLIRYGEAVVCHDLYDPRRDETAEELHHRTYVHSSRGKISWLMPAASLARLPRAGAFTDACSANYAHWLTEVLPKVNLFCREDSNADTPIVVDAGLHPNLVESLRLVAGDMRRIIALAPDETVLVENLRVFSAVGYVPFGRRGRAAGGHSHGLFSSLGLTALRDQLNGALAAGAGSGGVKLYLKRSADTRNAINRVEIEALLVEQGFTVIEPERLSFSEQVRMFASADIVVGVTGAAFANLIFCRPATRIVILVSNYRQLSYWYWQNIAYATGHRITYVIGVCTEWPSHPHSSYEVDIQDVLDAINERS